MNNTTRYVIALAAMICAHSARADSALVSTKPTRARALLMMNDIGASDAARQRIGASSIVPPTMPTPPYPEPPAGRIQCWQHGVLIFSEPLRESTGAPANVVMSAVPERGGSVSVLEIGNAICLLSLGEAAGGGTSPKR